MMAWDFTDKDQLLEAAWGLIANAHGGDWGTASPTWREAAERWRDGFHTMLPQFGDGLWNHEPSEAAIDG